jgi:hypothetical protein
MLFKNFVLFYLVWCPGENRKFALLSFFHGCRKRDLSIYSTHTCDELGQDGQLTTCHVCSISLS